MSYNTFLTPSPEKFCLCFPHVDVGTQETLSKQEITNISERLTTGDKIHQPANVPQKSEQREKRQTKSVREVPDHAHTQAKKKNQKHAITHTHTHTHTHTAINKNEFP